MWSFLQYININQPQVYMSPQPWTPLTQFSSVQFSCSVLSDSLWPHGPQHARPPSPSPAPRVYSNSSPLSRWCHPTISSSVIPFSSCLQSFPTSGSFQMSQLFASDGQSIGVSASTSVFPMNTQDWSISFRMDCLDLLAVQGTLKSLLQHHSSKASILRCSAFFTVQLSHPYMTKGKTIAFMRLTWEGNRQEGQGSPNGGNSLQVSDIFISLKRQEETN